MTLRLLVAAFAAVATAACVPQQAAPPAAPEATPGAAAPADDPNRLPPANARGAQFPPDQPDPALLNASIADGGSVRGDAEVTLAFRTRVRLVQVAVLTPDGDTLILPFRPTDASQTRYAITLPDLPRGNYQLSWAHDRGAGSRSFSVGL